MRNGFSFVAKYLIVQKFDKGLESKKVLHYIGFFPDITFTRDVLTCEQVCEYQTN